MTVNVPDEKPEDVLRRLSEGADSRRKRSLALVRDACEHQRTLRNPDFRVCTIAKLVSDKGGPSVKSFGNKSSRPHRTLIEAYRREYAPAPAIQRGFRPPTNDLAAGVRDPTQRAQIRDLQGRVAALRAQVIDLQRIANATARASVPAHGDDGSKAEFIGASDGELLPYEREALEQCLSPHRLKRLGLAEGSHGRLETEEGHEVFPAGFTTGLKKLLTATVRAAGRPAVDGSAIDGTINPTL